LRHAQQLIRDRSGLFGLSSPRRSHIHRPHKERIRMNALRLADCSVASKRISRPAPGNAKLAKFSPRHKTSGLPGRLACLGKRPFVSSARFRVGIAYAQNGPFRAVWTDRRANRLSRARSAAAERLNGNRPPRLSIRQAQDVSGRIDQTPRVEAVPLAGLFNTPWLNTDNRNGRNVGQRRLQLGPSLASDRDE